MTWAGSYERLVLKFYYRNYFCSKKYFQSLHYDEVT